MKHARIHLLFDSYMVKSQGMKQKNRSQIVRKKKLMTNLYKYCFHYTSEDYLGLNQFNLNDFFFGESKSQELFIKLLACVIEEVFKS